MSWERRSRTTAGFTVTRELLLSFLPCSYLMWELLIYMILKNCVHMYTDICMCVHVCAHAFGGQRPASSGAPQTLSLLGLSLAWNLLIQPGWLARKPPGTPCLQLCSWTITYTTMEGLLYVCSGLPAQVLMLAWQAVYQLSHIFSSYVGIR